MNTSGQTVINRGEPSTTRDFSQLSPSELAALISELEQNRLHLESKQAAERTLANFARLMRWQPDDTTQSWAERLLEELVTLTNGLQACLYLMQTQGGRNLRLRRIGGFALPVDSDVPLEIELGDGIVGQAAKTGRQVFFNQKARIETRSFSGTAQLHPASLLVLPLLYNEKVEGVLELACAEALSDEHLTLLHALGENMAANLMSIRSQEEMRRLFEEAQEKSEALLAQEEEMRQNVEELQATHEEMRRQQQEIVERENRLNTFINSSQDYIVALDPEYKVLLANRKLEEAYQMMGLVLELGVSYYPELCPPDFWKTIQPNIDKAFGGESLLVEVDFTVDFQPERLYYEVAIAPILNGQNQVYAVSVVSRDISLRKKFELEFKQQAARLQSILESLDDLLVKVDDTGQIRVFNPAAARTFRLNPEALPHYTTLLGDDHQAELTEELNRALTNEKFRTVRRVEAQYWEFNYNPIRDAASGAVLGLTILIRDVTAAIRSAQEIEEKNQALEAQQEELRQNLEELMASQEQVLQSKHEIEKLKEQEALRAREVAENQKRIMERAMQGFKQKEDQLKARIAALEQELTELKQLLPETVRTKR
jgi:PAS domain S-box-containing protein